MPVEWAFSRRVCANGPHGAPCVSGVEGFFSRTGRTTIDVPFKVIHSNQAPDPSFLDGELGEAGL